MFQDATWERGRVRLERGDVLVLYTDGITDAQDQEEAFYSRERLLACVQSHLGSLGSSSPSARGLQDAVLAEVHRFVGDAPQFDDIALAVVVREG